MKFPFKFLKDIGITLIAVIRVLLKSNLSSKCRHWELNDDRDSECWILGNGPSLKDDLPEIINKLKKAEIVVVNEFVKSPYYEMLKPRIYVIADPALGKEDNTEDVQNRVDNLFDLLKEKTKWDISFFIPNTFSENVKSKIENKFIKVYKYNVTPISNLNFITAFLIKHNFAMPVVQNVIIGCIIIAINLRYKDINILGADHSWFKNIELNKKHQVCITETYFFKDKKDIKYKPWFKNEYENEIYTMSEVLKILAKMYDSYYIVANYAKKQGARIKNKSSHTYLDAFPRE